MSLSLPHGFGSLHKLSSRSQYRRSSPETIGATASRHPGHFGDSVCFLENVLIIVYVFLLVLFMGHLIQEMRSTTILTVLEIRVLLCLATQNTHKSNQDIVCNISSQKLRPSHTVRFYRVGPANWELSL